MAELIRKEDTLNQGREKLNEAIKDADKAKNDSAEALNKAEEALGKSESTQTQLDTIVINGDSSVEAAQARVDEKGQSHTTLKDRIDDGFTKVNTQLAEKANQSDLQNEIESLDEIKADKGALAQVAQSKRDKDTEIEMKDLSQEVKESMTGGSVAVVGEDAVGTVNLKDNAVTVDKLNKDVMVRTPWLESEESNLDYIWLEGNYAVHASALNNPVGATAHLTVERSRTLSTSSVITVKQTITSAQTSANLVTYYRVLRVNEITLEFFYVKPWTKVLSDKVESENMGKTYNMRFPWLNKETDDLDYVWDTGTYMISADVKNNPLREISILEVVESKTMLSSAQSWIRQTITLSHVSREPIKLYRVLKILNGEIDWKKDWQSLSGESYAGVMWVALGTSMTQRGEYTDFVTDELGLILDNRGVGGGGITTNAEAGNTTMQAIEAIEDFNGIVSIEIGPNDWLRTPLGELGDTEDSTWYGAVDKVCRTVSKRTSARPFIITSPITAFSVGADFDETKRRSVYYKSSQFGIKYIEYVNAAKEVAQHYSIPVCDVYGESGLGSYHQNSATLTDHIHLSTIGGAIMGGHIANFLKYKFRPFPSNYNNPLAIR